METFPADSMPVTVIPERPSVLVVDDDQAMREFLGASLRLAGFDVRLVADGIAALREVDERRPDVVLLDLDLPIMNGFAVHEALRMQASTRELPIVVVSGTGWASPSPVAARLDKPVPADALIGIGEHRHAEFELPRELRDQRRRVHVPVPDPGDEQQLRDDHGDGDPGGGMDVRDQVRQRVPEPAGGGHEPAHQAAGERPAGARTGP